MTPLVMLDELRDLLYDLERTPLSGKNDARESSAIQQRRQCDALREAIALLEKQAA